MKENKLQRFVFEPHNRVYIIWETMQCLIILFYYFLIPIEFFSDVYTSVLLKILSILLSILLSIDLFLMFFRAYYKKGILVLD